ncbi:MAG: ArsR family transcriptional regulator [Thermoprotei archaeon]|nr:MAG: ArsR family transcriptional regulator [Thermoprotei archaeon]
MKVKDALREAHMPHDVVEYYRACGRLEEEVAPPSDEVVMGLVELLKCLANPTRLKLMALLKRPHCVCVLSSALGLDMTLTSHHLARLRRCGLARTEPIARARVYERDDEALRKLVAELLDVLGVRLDELSARSG